MKQSVLHLTMHQESERRPTAWSQAVVHTRKQTVRSVLEYVECVFHLTGSASSGAMGVTERVSASGVSGASCPMLSKDISEFRDSRSECKLGVGERASTLLLDIQGRIYNSGSAYTLVVRDKRTSTPPSTSNAQCALHAFFTRVRS
jgi:hypothetical protein